MLVGLKKIGKYDPVLISLGSDIHFVEPLRKNNITIIYVLRKIRWDITLYFKLGQIIKKYNPSIIHTTCWMTTVLVLPIAKIKKIIVINNSIRNAFSSGGIKWKMEKLLLLLSDIRLANSYAGLKSR